ncbi:MAG: N-acetylmuramoyl-L-alanine amidase [Deltaproteobacteria bacterium]|nr:N-acetylmuramoyl-L-alanine amidase [Deltaproteobacteria bacterium]
MKRWGLLSALTILILFFSFPLGAGAMEESMYQDARDAYFALEKSAEKRKFRHNWIKVIDLYTKVYENYKKGTRGDESLYMAGKLYVELRPYSGNDEDLRESNKLLASLVNDYPSSSLADDALYMMGENYEKLGQKEKAYERYQNILEHYNSGDRRRDAGIKAARLKRPVRKVSYERKNPPPVKKVNPGKASGHRTGNGSYAQVKDIRHWSNPNYTRIVVHLDKPVKYKDHLLKKDPAIGKPPRLYIDISGAKKKRLIEEKIPIHDGLLKMARAAQYDRDTVRVVLDIESIKEYRIFPMLEPFRIVIDVWGEKKPASATIDALLPDMEEEVKKLKENPNDGSIPLARQLGLGIRKIVIDPGHGGKDPGAVGPRGTKEKHVTLKIAKSLKAVLEKDYGYQVVLTRDRDRYLQLDERTAIANMENADLFISIHVNANRNRRAYGMETYVMNARATNRYVSEVAARENAVTMHSMGEYGSILEDILVQLQKTNKINESNKLAHKIQRSMKNYMSKRYKRIKNHGVKKGPFYVLIGAQMPSVLVETGFISNRAEEKRLNNSKYIRHLSKAIALGVDKYSGLIKTASSR